MTDLNSTSNVESPPESPPPLELPPVHRQASSANVLANEPSRVISEASLFAVQPADTKQPSQIQPLNLPPSQPGQQSQSNQVDELLNSSDFKIDVNKKHVESALALVDEVLSGRVLNTSNVVGIVYKLIEFLKKQSGLSGESKKQLLIAVIRAKVEEQNIGSDEKQLILMFVDTFLGTVVDQLVSQAKQLTSKCCV